MIVPPIAPRAAAGEVQLRPMTADEFARFREEFVRAWAEDLAKVEDLDPALALAQAAARTDAELPQGLETPGHRLSTVTADGRAVGSLWLSREGGRAFLEEVTIAEAERGRGLGRRAIALAEEAARAEGATQVVLNVYAHNPRAQELYAALGYREVKTTMRKLLQPPGS